MVVWCQREQQHGGGYWISATGKAAGTGVSVTTVMFHLSIGAFPDVEFSTAGAAVNGPIHTHCYHG